VLVPGTAPVDTALPASHVAAYDVGACLRLRDSGDVLCTSAGVLMVRNTSLLGCGFSVCCAVNATGVFCCGSNSGVGSGFAVVGRIPQRVVDFPSTLRPVAFSGPDGANRLWLARSLSTPDASHSASAASVSVLSPTVL
jgi:hypothetical protein